MVDNTRRRTLQPHVREHVEKDAQVFTNALASYTGLNAEYVQQVGSPCGVPRQREHSHERFGEFLELVQMVHQGNAYFRGTVSPFPLP